MNAAPKVKYRISYVQKNWHLYGVRVALLAIVLFGLFIVSGCKETNFEVQQPVSFKGERIRLIVNFGAGGSTDRFARTLAPYLSKHLPGNPTVIVENKIGAGGVLGASYVYRAAKPDGRTLCVCNGTAMRWGPVRDFPIDVRRYAVVGGTQFNAVLVAGGALNIKTISDLVTYKGRLLESANSPVAPNPIRSRLLLSRFGEIKFKAIGGFPTAGMALASVRQGETGLTGLHSDSFIAYRDELNESGEGVGLMQSGFVDADGTVRRSRNIDLPTYDEVWRSLPGDATETPEYRLARAYDLAGGVQTIFALPPDTPKNIEDVWASALESAFNDSEFLSARASQRTDETIFADRQTTQERIAVVGDLFADPEIIETLEQWAPALRK